MSFIVAEIGVNWDGDFTLLEEMMNHAKNSGCDAIKFQSFNKNIIGDHPEYERLIKTSVSESNIKKINELSQTVGIEWFSTPMYIEAIDFLDQYVKRFKIREFDSRQLLENKTTELVKKAVETGKEIIISSQHPLKNSKEMTSNLLR